MSAGHSYEHAKPQHTNGRHTPAKSTSSAAEFSELSVAHSINLLHARAYRAAAAAHRAEWEKTGCLASLATAWRHDELAEECELIVKELAAVLALAREDSP